MIGSRFLSGRKIVHLLLAVHILHTPSPLLNSQMSRTRETGVDVGHFVHILQRTCVDGDERLYVSRRQVGLGHEEQISK